MNYLIVFIGGGLGSISRFGISQWMTSSPPSSVFPLATLTANLLSCLIMGIAVFFLRDRLNSDWSFFIITGFCGGFSTFSTFSMETLLLLQHQHYLTAALNILISVAGCFLLLYFLLKLN